MTEEQDSAVTAGRGGAAGFTDNAATHTAWYIERFRALAADGADLAGEARFLDALLARGSRVLDAGCGPGRVGAALREAGTWSSAWTSTRP